MSPHESSDRTDRTVGLISKHMGKEGETCDKGMDEVIASREWKGSARIGEKDGGMTVKPYLI